MYSSFTRHYDSGAVGEVSEAKNTLKNDDAEYFVEYFKAMDLLCFLYNDGICEASKSRHNPSGSL